ncbi:hypothetical protein QFW96_04145 [Saccharopolyspora sp. TS4A08]|uniref:Low molecular weight antigen MTB12-like C-terminal domain-containing protein n=1 Tax=Saccharopolyspora ipomoeae TaxID=3042027 RepID=A0ABT6PIF8_9PSEU|nr:hypothetical protein [Saccharopolyspora sp. TS4A08]MDI2027783.1 hypothetical protein [Saccharopolyspora sp. TS4A08]
MTSSPNEPGQGGSEKKPADETENSAPEQASENATAAGHGEAETGAEQSGAEKPGAEQTDAAEAETAEADKSETAAETPETEGSEAPEAAATAETGESAEAGEQPKKKRKTGMIIAVAASVVVLAAVAAGAFWLFSSGSAQAAAEDYAAISTKETQDPRSVTADDYRPVVCNAAMPQIEELQKQKEEFLKVAKPQDFEMLKQVKTTVKGVQENGDSGTATMESTVPGQQPATAQLKLVKEDGDWKLCA